MRAVVIFLVIFSVVGGGWWYYHTKGLPHIKMPHVTMPRMSLPKMAGAIKPAPGGPMGKMPGAMMGPLPVEAATIVPEDLPVTATAVGTLSASESAEIRAEIAGPLRAINFTEGQPVKKGDSMLEIDDSLIAAALMKAEATYETRRNAFDRSDKLKTSGFVSSQDWEENRGSLQEAQADIESAKASLAKTKVIAPFDGVAGLRSVSIGDYVQMGQMLTTLDAIDQMKITFSVPEKAYGSVRPPQKISFSVDAWPDESFAGEIYAVSPRVNEASRNFDVKAMIPNPDGRLRSGMFARITITTEVRQGALTVPEQSIVPKDRDSYVFVVRDGKAVFQKVSTGLRLSGKVEVTDGITAGEQVVTAGIMKLQDGMPVQVTAP